MLNIYIGKENLPENISFIIDADSAFGSVVMSGTDFQRMVISKVELGEYLDNSAFKDRFGNRMLYMYMSTGSKSLCLLEASKGKAVNLSECGENALRMLSYISEGNIYFDNRQSALPWDVDYPVMCNGRVWDRVSLLNDFLR